MSSWVGINDGPGIIQAGTAQVIEPQNFAGILWGNSRTTFAWVEWFPNELEEVENLPAEPGDEFSVELGWEPPNSAFYWLVNVSQGVEAFVTLTEPSGGTISGEQAEWIVENYEIPGVDPLYLPKFASVSFVDCGGLVRLPPAMVPKGQKNRLQSFNLGSGVNWINMVSRYNRVMAEPVSLGPTSMMVNYISPGN